MNNLKILSALLVIILAQSLCGTSETVTPTSAPTTTAGIATIDRVKSNVMAGPVNNLKDVTGLQDLQNNDAVNVSDGGVAQLEFPNQVSLKLFNDTSVGGVSADVSGTTNGRIRLKLERGGLSGQVVKPGEGASFEIANGATITILGTQFFVVFNIDTKIVSAGNFDGSVAYTTPGGTTQALPAGKLVDILPDNTVTIYDLPFTRDDFENFAQLDSSPIQGLNDLRTKYKIPLAGVISPTPNLTPIVKATNTPTSIPQTTLTVYSIPDDVYLDRALQNAIAAYEKDHPGIRVDYQVIPANDALNRILTDFAAGQGADIIIWDNNQIGKLATNGIITPLDLDLGDVMPSASAGVSWQKSIWGMPLTVSGIALIYNTDIAKPDYFPSNPNDLSALLEKSKVYSENNPSQNLFCNPGLGQNGTAPAYFAAPILLGVGYPDNLKVPGYIDEFGGIYLTYPSVITGGNLISIFPDYTWPNADYETCKALFLKGQTAAFWTGSWDINMLINNGMNIGVIPMGRPFVTSKAALLTSAARERGNDKIASDLITYLANPAVEVRYAEESGQIIPANISALKELKNGIVFDFGFALIDGVAETPSQFEDRQWEPINQAVIQIWIGKSSPEAALGSAQESINLVR